MLFECLTAFFAAIQLTGVTGEDLRARAFFDANNVKVGDPMVLTIDFLGEADFKALHPPALSKAVDKRDWKLDDVSAKTDTFRDARRLTYRIRPMREGVLWFPGLEFEYDGTDGVRRRVRSNEIPVHAKVGAQVVVEEMGEDVNEMPQPPELIKEVSSFGSGKDSASPLGKEAASPLADVEFAWKKALAKPTADAFAAFDFPEAKMNEATCAIREGNWARAMKIYQVLEWRIGQTPEIERGIVAALALRHDNPAVELPVWRQVLRPILRYGWKGRVGLVGGGFAALALLFWLLGRGIKAVACLALTVGVVSSAGAQGLFQQMEEQMNRMRQQMHQQMQSFGGGGFNFSFGGEEQREQVKIKVSAEVSKPSLQVGEPFEFVLSLEYPRTASVGQIQIIPSETFGLTFTGQAKNIEDGTSVNPTNVVKRLAVPARYDVPFKGRVAFAVEGMVSGRQTRRGGMFTMSFSNSFRSDTDPISIDVKPLTDQPEDFGGIISEGLRFHETCDILTVGTNDVVTISYRLFPNGHVPADFLPKGAAFEWSRQTDRNGRVAEIEYRRYFVANGEPATPKASVSYYDPRTRRFKTATTGGTPLKYVP